MLGGPDRQKTPSARGSSGQEGLISERASPRQVKVEGSSKSNAFPTEDLKLRQPKLLKPAHSLEQRLSTLAARSLRATSMSSFVRIDASLFDTSGLAVSATSHNGRVGTTANRVTAGHRTPPRSPSPGSSSGGELILQFSAEDLELNSRQPRTRLLHTQVSSMTSGYLQNGSPSGMNYQYDVPALPPLPTNATQPAPADVVGIPPDQLGVYRASADERLRFQVSPAIVTAQDVAYATLRTAAITQQHLTAMYPHQAPHWAIALQQQLQQSHQQLQQSHEQLREQLQQSEQRSQQQLTRIDGALHNMRAVSFNTRVVRNFEEGFPPRDFRRFVKLTPGLGGRLPHARDPRHRIPLLQVGEIVPHRFFPATPATLGRWSLGKISDLSILLNDDFGIDRADRLEDCRHKLLLYLTTP